MFSQVIRRLRALAVPILVAFLALPLLAQTTVTPQIGPALTFTIVPVDNSLGDQYDPHVEGDWTAYTSAVVRSEIRYYNFVSGTNAVVPFSGTVPETDILSDVHGGRIAYSRITADRNAIMLFDIASGTLTEINPQSGSNRLGTAIGGNTIAYVDFSAGNGDISVYDIPTGVTTRLTDAANEQNPNVSPDGNTVVWERCQTSLTSCEILMAVKGTGGQWTVSVVTSTGPSSNPDTNGRLVVYDHYFDPASNERDIYIYTIATGTTQRLAFPGADYNPSIAGNFVAFENQASALSAPEIYLYDISLNQLYQVTNTPTVTEQLNDVTVLPNGQVRVVWSGDDGPGGERNIYAATITPPCAPRQFVLDASVSYSPPSVKFPPIHIDALVTPQPPLPFLLPGKLPVTSGNAGSGFSTLSFKLGRQLPNSCLYQGANGGTGYKLLGCVPLRLAVGSQVTADTLFLRVWDAAYPGARVRVELNDATCK